MKKMDDLQSQIKNDKIRQHIQDSYRGEDGELRVGIAAPCIVSCIYIIPC